LQSMAKSTAHSDHVVEIFDFWFNTNVNEHIYRSFILMRLCEGTLESHVAQIRESTQHVTSQQLFVIMDQILSGLQHCHEHGICHRDLKMSNGTPPYSLLNIVLFHNDRCSCHGLPHGKSWVLADFGFSTISKISSSTISTTRRGTDAYRSPEIADVNFDTDGNLQPAEVSRKSDIWAIGCILFRLATTDRRAPFWNDYAVVAYKRQYPGHDVPQLTEFDNPALSETIICPDTGLVMQVWEQINIILKLCFERNPAARPTAAHLRERFEACALNCWFSTFVGDLARMTLTALCAASI